MIFDACLKLVRVDDPDTILGPVRGSGDLFRPSGMTISEPDIGSVLVDHDPNQQIGEVFALEPWAFPDGGRWVVGRCRIDAPPSWLRRGTPASLGSRPLQTSEMNGWTIIGRPLVDEISIVSASHCALEPCAEVALYRQAKEPKPTVQPAGEMIYTPLDAILRRPSGQILGVR